MTRGPDTCGCMLDRAGSSSELFRFSTTALQWEQLDADLVSGSPPSVRSGHAMAAVGSDIFVFGGFPDQGEEARCACWPPSGVMSEIAPAIVPRTAAVRARPHGLGTGGRAWCHQGLVVTQGAVQPFLRWHRVSQRAHHEEHVHNVVIESLMVHRGCRVEDRIGM